MLTYDGIDDSTVTLHRWCQLWAPVMPADCLALLALLATRACQLVDLVPALAATSTITYLSTSGPRNEVILVSVAAEHDGGSPYPFRHLVPVV